MSWWVGWVCRRCRRRSTARGTATSSLWHGEARPTACSPSPSPLSSSPCLFCPALPLSAPSISCQALWTCVLCFGQCRVCLRLPGRSGARVMPSPGRRRTRCWRRWVWERRLCSVVQPACAAPVVIWGGARPDLLHTRFRCVRVFLSLRIRSLVLSNCLFLSFSSPSLPPPTPTVCTPGSLASLPLSPLTVAIPKPTVLLFFLPSPGCVPRCPLRLLVPVHVASASIIGRTVQAKRAGAVCRECSRPASPCTLASYPAAPRRRSVLRLGVGPPCASASDPGTPRHQTPLYLGAPTRHG